MRIAHVSPLFDAVPPRTSGGPERVVSYLTEALVRQGHEVTLFASGDSVTRARLVASCPEGLRFDDRCTDPFAHHLVLLEQVFQQAADFDLSHFHLDDWHFPLSRRQSTPHLTTRHGRLALPDLVAVYQAFPEPPVVSISKAQRAPLPWLNWQGTVSHGLPPDLYTFRPEPGPSLACLGRMAAEKRGDRAIAIATRVGLPLTIAAKVDATDHASFDAAIAPQRRHPLVDYVGEVGDGEKEALLGNASALRFPIDWPEPFGRVMIEAMACGTPVIACRRGAVPEVVDDGVTGCIVDGLDEAVRAVARLPTLRRQDGRQAFETRFSAARAAMDYVAIYRRLAAREGERHSVWSTSR
jgi:glycosyltransferase involved in cell wall biosynthesis